jgi:phytoene dehydrogenase-like protein
LNDLYRVVMPGACDITLKTDREQVVAELQGQFPREKEAIERFFELAYRFANELLAVFYFRDPEASRDKYPILYQYALRTCKEVLDAHFTDPLLKAVVSVYWGYLGLPPNRLSFAYLALLFFTYIEFKPFHLKGGSQALSNAILSRFLSHGGTAHFNCAATRVLMEEGRVQGVVTEHGDTIRAKYLVSNVSPVATYLQLIGAEQVPEGALTEMRGRSLGPSAFVMFMGFDCEPGELGIQHSTSFIMSHTDIEERPYEEMWQVESGPELMVLSCYDIADPEFSPEGACQASLVTLKFGEPWLRIPPTEYYQTKYRCADSMLRAAERVYPALRDHIEELEVATPLTHMRYLGHPNGAIYGFEQQTKDSLFFQPGRHSPIQGLYFASSWSGDCGFQPTLEAGKAVAKSILKDLGA